MLLSQEELAQSAVMHPEIAQIFAGAPQPDAPLSDEAVAAAVRESMAAMDAALLNGLGSPPEGSSEAYKQITMRDSYSSKIKIHRPSAGGGPLVVLCFGGGFLGGSCEQLSPVARQLVHLFGATAVTVDYRLGPEYKFPHAQHDVWDTMIWIADNAKGSDLSADPSKGFILGGVSAGACTTAALSRQFQAAPLTHQLTGQWLCVPLLMDSSSVPEKYKSHFVSREQNALNPTLPTDSIDAIMRIVGIDTKSPLIFPVLAETPVSGQPKTYFQVVGMDPVRDDGLIYEEMLKESGVETKLDFYPGCPHGYHAMAPQLEVAKKFSAETLVGFGWLLGKEVSKEEAAKVAGS